MNAPTVLIRLPEVERRTGRKKSWIYAAKDFPKPVKQGRDNMWAEHEVEAYIQRLLAARDAANDD